MEDRLVMARLEKKVDDLIERRTADGGDGDMSEAAEDPHAWVGVVRKNMLIKLKQDFITARKPWEAYKTMGEHNLTLVDLVAGHLGFTEEEANAKLMTRIPASRRRNSRATGMGRQVLVTGSRNRTVLTLTREEAIHLLSGDRYISEGFGKKALLAGASNMFAALGAGHLFEESSPDSADKTVVCILAQMALVSTKVREHLKLRAYGGLAAQATAAGVNEGHRQPWIRELATLDRVYWRLPETCNGLRLVDAASPLRATANRPPPRESGAAAAGAGGAVADGGDDDDGDDDGYSAEAVGDGLLEELD
eukprot:contig_21169_g5198